MSRTSALAALVLLAVVVAVAVGTASAVAADSETAQVETAAVTDGEVPLVTDTANTTNYLSPETTERQTYVRSDVDVVAAAGMSVQRLHARHERRVFDSRFDSAAGSDRLSLVRETADRVDARLDRLDDRHAALLGAYSNGTLSRETLLRRLARLSVTAQSARNRLQHVSDRADASATFLPVSLETRLSDLQTSLITLPNPVEDRIEAGLGGGRDPVVVYAGGADSALVLGTVDNGDFVRSSSLRDEYAPDQPDQFEQADGRSIIVALRRGEQLYPWTYENDIGGPQIRGFGNTGVYFIRVNHPHGVLETYLSGGTRNAFHEIQTKNPDAVPVTGTVSNVNSSLNVTVETTSPSGPMRVTIIQPSSGARLDGTILVDGQVVGRTGDDGRLWTVQPVGVFRVNATTGANSVEVTVR